MINLTYAREKFAEYLSGYDRNDDKINLKAIHTYCVLDAADAICRGEGFSQEDYELALFIALLHDIGRFEQLKRFHSFSDSLMNHADFGVKVLFEEGMIREFINDTRYDTIIRKAIQYHSLFRLPEHELTEKELLHCRIIRDADKLDNFRVKDTEKLETLFDTPESIVAQEEISPHILDTVRSRQCVYSPDRVTHLDSWVSYLAFIFDLNFPSSFLWIKERDYLNRNVDRISCQNLKTRREMEEIRKICNQYICEKAVHPLRP